MRRPESSPLPPGEVEPRVSGVRVRAAPGQIGRARGLRRRQTEAEARLWRCLRNRGMGVKFKRQAPVGPYIVDFLCSDPMLIIEVDGSQHAADQEEHDRIRDRYLSGRGFAVHRYWNRQVLAETDAVLRGIGLVIEALTRRRAASSTSPGGRGDLGRLE